MEKNGGKEGEGGKVCARVRERESLRGKERERA